ncbi:hypothetical protein [Guggenheimella bovis]
MKGLLRGRGKIGLLLIVASFLVSLALSPFIGKKIALAVFFLGAGVLQWVLLRSLPLSTPEKVYIDPVSGTRTKFKNLDTILWIPLRYIGFILTLIGIVMIFSIFK